MQNASLKKNKEQSEVLDLEYDRNSSWTKAKMRELGD